MPIVSSKCDFEVRLTRKEYSALMDIRGCDERAHTMIMCAKLHEDGDWMLQGPHEAFDALLVNLHEEIGLGLAPKKNLPALRRIREYITPDYDDGEEP
jgi:hypothetical protein